MSLVTRGFGKSTDSECEKKLKEKDEEIKRFKKIIEELEGVIEDLKRIKD